MKTHIVAFLSAVLLVAMVQVANAQETEECPDGPKKEFTIENCVNQFNMEGTVKTGVYPLNTRKLSCSP
jgi:hypothetical protein